VTGDPQGNLRKVGPKGCEAKSRSALGVQIWGDKQHVFIDLSTFLITVLKSGLRQVMKSTYAVYRGKEGRGFDRLIVKYEDLDRKAFNY
jgi:hypothetical protein